MDSGHAIRVEAGASFVWSELPPLVEGLEGVSPGTERLYLRRRKASHRGLGALASLRQLWMLDANQDAIEEIGRLSHLEMLFVRGLTAASLEPLAGLGRLERLILIGGGKVEDLSWAGKLAPSLRVLVLEGFWRASDIAPLASLVSLTTLGFEGGMDKRVRIDSLAPLAGLAALRYLFLANAEVQDKSLAPLQGLARLKRLECSIRFPDAEFLALAEARPELACDWIDAIAAHGSLRKASADILARLRRP